MESEFIRTKNGEFTIKQKRIILRGFSIGSWMNMESFMLRIPGSDRQIRQAFA